MIDVVIDESGVRCQGERLTWPEIRAVTRFPVRKAGQAHEAVVFERKPASGTLHRRSPDPLTWGPAVTQLSPADSEVIMTAARRWLPRYAVRSIAPDEEPDPARFTVSGWPPALPEA